jgi:hypothetical protein
MRLAISSLLKRTVIVAATLALLPVGGAFADAPGGVNVPLQQAPTEQANESGLELRLQTVKKDLLIFLTFAEHFIRSGETKTAAQLQGPLDDYLRRHADYLVVRATESSNIEMIQLSAEVTLIKIRLLIALNYRDDANAVLAEMKRLFAPYQQMSVQILGKTTTLDEAIRLMDGDMARIAASKK